MARLGKGTVVYVEAVIAGDSSEHREDNKRSYRVRVSSNNHDMGFVKPNKILVLLDKVKKEDR